MLQVTLEFYDPPNTSRFDSNATVIGNVIALEIVNNENFRGWLDDKIREMGIDIKKITIEAI